jgi:hypothetical protein
LRLRASKKEPKTDLLSQPRRSIILKFKFQPTESKPASDLKQKLEWIHLRAMDPSESNPESLLAAALADQQTVERVGEQEDTQNVGAICEVASPPLHPYRWFRKKGNTKLKFQPQVQYCMSYLKNTEPFCRHWSTPKRATTPFTTCKCIHWLAADEMDEEREAVSHYMVFHFRKSKVEKQETVMDWMRYTLDSKTKKRFLLPFFASRDFSRSVGLTELEQNIAEEYMNKLSNLQGTRICLSALGTLLGFSKDFYTTCKNAIAANTLPKHGLAGKKGNKSNRGLHFVENGMNIDLNAFLAGLEKEAEVRSTVAVRDRVGDDSPTVLRGEAEDGVKEDVFLPAYYSKRGLFERFCKSRGVIATSTATGYNKAADPAASNVQEVPNWITFRRFWSKHYSHMFVSKPSRDICDTCHVFANRFKAAANRQKGDDSDESDKDSDNDNGPEEAEVNGKLVDFQLERTEESDILTETIKEASLHVKQADDQRRACTEKINKSTEDFAQKKDHRHAVRTIVVDYSQNIGIPQLGQSQPGQTYYLSPLNVFVFGIVYCGVQGGTLDAYVYTEGKRADFECYYTIFPSYHP